MKKITKKFFVFTFSLSILTPTFYSMFYTSSCNSNNEPDVPITDDHFRYIYERTFSISVEYAPDSSHLYWVRGTSWIVNKDIGTQSEYKYWMATNLHVSYPMFEAESIIRKNYKYAFFSSKGSYADYKPINPTFISVDTSSSPYYFSFDGTEKKQSIDFSIFSIDFSQSVQSDKKLKDKLDNLNAFYTKNGYINKFKNVNSEQNNVYFAGYPAEYITTDEATENTLWSTYSCDRTQYLSLSTEPHYIDGNDLDSSNYCDISANLKYSYIDLSKWSTSSKFQMLGGSSGSMLIDEEYNVVGIYWGGTTYTKNYFYYPKFSIFKDNNINFVKNFE